MIPSRRVLGSLLLLFGVIGTAALAGPQARPAQADPDPLLAARTKGAATAPVTVYEMSDFQCPFCRRQAMETFPSLERDFIATGKVRWVFINFPLTQLHPNAAAAAEFAMCAAKVDKFWPIHDLLFKYQDKWAPLKEPGAFLLTLADSAGIPRVDITGCLEKGETRDLVKADAEGAARAGAASTPSFYIEGGLLAGAAPVTAFEQVLDSIWKAKGGK
jgi:protein-disulfide isomerase